MRWSDVDGQVSESSNSSAPQASVRSLPAPCTLTGSPPSFLTRLLWRRSKSRSSSVSCAALNKTLMATVLPRRYELGAALFIGWAGSVLCIVGGVMLCFSIAGSFTTRSEALSVTVLLSDKTLGQRR